MIASSNAGGFPASGGGECWSLGIILLSTDSFDGGVLDCGDGKKKRSRKRYPNRNVVLNAATHRM